MLSFFRGLLSIFKAGDVSCREVHRVITVDILNAVIKGSDFEEVRAHIARLLLWILIVDPILLVIVDFNFFHRKSKTFCEIQGLGPPMKNVICELFPSQIFCSLLM